MKILTSIIVSGIFYYICYWVTKDDSTRELIFASLIAITILILCILELLGFISF
nr:MAG TPA: SCIMP protein [Caudoviricetes sp.]